MLHAAIDFDLQFGSLAVLLVLLLVGEGAASFRLFPVPAKGLWGGVLCLALCLPASFMGFRCGSLSSALSAANATGKHDTCIELFESSRWTRGDQVTLKSYNIPELYRFPESYDAAFVSRFYSDMETEKMTYKNYE